MIKTRTTTLTDKLENTEIIIKQPLRRKNRRTSRPEFIVHSGSSTITYSNLLSEIARASLAVTDRERREFPHPVLIMKPEVITLKWCKQPEPKPSSGFNSRGEFCITLNLLGYRRIGVDFLNEAVDRLRSKDANGAHREVSVRPIRGPWVFKLSFI